MATAGTFLADPTLADYADEAFERAGLQPQAIGAEHIRSLRRSIKFMFSRWANKGEQQWKFDQIEHTVTINEMEFDLPAGTIDVTKVVHRRAGKDTEMYPIARADYLLLHDKTLIGRPDRYFVDKRRDTPGDAVPMRMFYWFAAENSTDQIIVDLFKQIEDPGTAGAGTLDIPFRFQEAFITDLAARVAQKFKPERYSELRGEAEVLFKEAEDEDSEMAPIRISVSYGGRYGRG